MRSLLQLRGCDCRWPIGEPDSDQMFCAALRAPGRPYCEDPCRVAYVPTPKGDVALPREAA